MDPITIGLMLAGTGLSLFGGMGAAKESKKQAAISQQIFQQEKLANEQRRQAMELDSSRRKIENIRQGQLAQSMALSTTVNQGAQFGSGASGGLAQVTNQTYWNDLGISQNLQIGQNLFAIDDKIGGLKSQMSASQSKQSTYQGYSAMGQSLVGSAGTIGQMSRGFGSLGGATVTPTRTWADFMRDISPYNKGGFY